MYVCSDIYNFSKIPTLLSRMGAEFMPHVIYSSKLSRFATHLSQVTVGGGGYQNLRLLSIFYKSKLSMTTALSCENPSNRGKGLTTDGILHKFYCSDGHALKTTCTE